MRYLMILICLGITFAQDTTKHSTSIKKSENSTKNVNDKMETTKVKRYGIDIDGTLSNFYTSDIVEPSTIQERISSDTISSSIPDVNNFGYLQDSQKFYQGFSSSTFKPETRYQSFEETYSNNEFGKIQIPNLNKQFGEELVPYSADWFQNTKSQTSYPLRGKSAAVYSVEQAILQFSQTANGRVDPVSTIVPKSKKRSFSIEKVPEVTSIHKKGPLVPSDIPSFDELSKIFESAKSSKVPSTVPEKILSSRLGFAEPQNNQKLMIINDKEQKSDFTFSSTPNAENSETYNQKKKIDEDIGHDVSTIKSSVITETVKPSEHTKLVELVTMVSTLKLNEIVESRNSQADDEFVEVNSTLADKSSYSNNNDSTSETYETTDQQIKLVDPVSFEDLLKSKSNEAYNDFTSDSNSQVDENFLEVEGAPDITEFSLNSESNNFKSKVVATTEQIKLNESVDSKELLKSNQTDNEFTSVNNTQVDGNSLQVNKTDNKTEFNPNIESVLFEFKTNETTEQIKLVEPVRYNESLKLESNSTQVSEDSLNLEEPHSPENTLENDGNEFTSESDKSTEQTNLLFTSNLMKFKEIFDSTEAAVHNEESVPVNITPAEVSSTENDRTKIGEETKGPLDTYTTMTTTPKSEESTEARGNYTSVE